MAMVIGIVVVIETQISIVLIVAIRILEVIVIAVPIGINPAPNRDISGFSITRSRDVGWSPYLKPER